MNVSVCSQGRHAAIVYDDIAVCDESLTALVIRLLLSRIPLNVCC